MGKVRAVGENRWISLPLGEGWVDMGSGGSRGRQGGEVGDANLEGGREGNKECLSFSL